jgi:hypothetical protein
VLGPGIVNVRKFVRQNCANSPTADKLPLISNSLVVHTTLNLEPSIHRTAAPGRANPSGRHPPSCVTRRYALEIPGL